MPLARTNRAMWSRSRSLLRYPGSKARFAKFIAHSLQLNGLRKGLFVEPFCGGASVAIALLEQGVVSEIALNDADPAVAAFWDTVFNRKAAIWLAEQVRTIPLTLEEWTRQKHLAPRSTREAALRCLYLNRTSFNGILQKRSGPIGGWSQKNRTLDARFNREALAKRIVELKELSDRVIAVDGDHWHSFVKRFVNMPKVAIYLDPPFYHKADGLYDYYFNDDEHNYLCDTIRKWDVPWLLSYDDAPEIRELYGNLGMRSRTLDNIYSAHPIGGSSHVGRELLFTNLPRLPAPGSTFTETGGLTVLSGNGGRRISIEGPIRRPNTISTILRKVLSRGTAI